jgi:hypothetical protein
MKPFILTYRDLETILRYTNRAKTEPPPGMLDEINRQLDFYSFARILESDDRKAAKDWLIENGRQIQECGQRLLLRDDSGGSYLMHFLTRAAVQHAGIHGPPLEIGIDQVIDHKNAIYCVEAVINSMILFSNWCRLIEDDLEGEAWMTSLLVDMQPEVRLIGDHLPAIYEKYLGEKFGVTISSDGTRPGGPGSRFVVGLLEKAQIKNQKGEPYSVNTIKKYVSDVRKNIHRRK